MPDEVAHLQAPPTPPQLPASPPTLTMVQQPSQIQQPQLQQIPISEVTTQNDIHSALLASAVRKDSPPPEPVKDEPKFVPGMLALCGACGYLSEDFNKCMRCQRKLPENVKSITATIRATNGQKRESILAQQRTQQLQQQQQSSPAQQQQQQQASSAQQQQQPQPQQLEQSPVSQSTPQQINQTGVKTSNPQSKSVYFLLIVTYLYSVPSNVFLTSVQVNIYKIKELHKL